MTTQLLDRPILSRPALTRPALTHSRSCDCGQDLDCLGQRCHCPRCGRCVPSTTSYAGTTSYGPGNAVDPGYVF